MKMNCCCLKNKNKKSLIKTIFDLTTKPNFNVYTSMLNRNIETNLNFMKMIFVHSVHFLSFCLLKNKHVKQYPVDIEFDRVFECLFLGFGTHWPEFGL